jgi:mRNA interferase MazF
MVKNYFLALLDWCKVSVVLWNKHSSTLFREGEIWWCAIGLNIGEEVFGKGAGFMRPVLVFRRLTENSFLGLPLTGSEKTGSWYVPITLPSRRSSIMLNQARIIDKKRLQRRITTVDTLVFKSIKDAFHGFYCS